MKKVILISTVVFMALTFTSCSNNKEEKVVTAVESVEVAPTYHPSGLDSLEVSQITNPAKAKSVWLGDTGKISYIAYNLSLIHISRTSVKRNL